MIVFQSVCAVFVVPNIWKKAKLRKYCSQIFHIWNNSRLSTPFPVLNVFHCFRKSLPNQIDASHVSLLQKDFPTPPLPSEVGWVPLPIAFCFGSAVACCKRHLKGVSHLWGESKLTPTGQQRLPEGETLLPQTTNLPMSHGGTFHCQPSVIVSLFSSPPPAGPPFRYVAARRLLVTLWWSAVYIISCKWIMQGGCLSCEHPGYWSILLLLLLLLHTVRPHHQHFQHAMRCPGHVAQHKEGIHCESSCKWVGDSEGVPLV